MDCTKLSEPTMVLQLIPWPSIHQVTILGVTLLVFFVRPGGGRYLAPGSNIYAIRKNASGSWEFIDGASFDDTEATVLYSNLNGEMPYDGIWGSS